MNRVPVNGTYRQKKGGSIERDMDKGIVPVYDKKNNEIVRIKRDGYYGDRIKDFVQLPDDVLAKLDK